MVIAIDQKKEHLQTNMDNCKMFRIEQKVEHINARFEDLHLLKPDILFLNPPVNKKPKNNHFFSVLDENIVQ